MAIKLSENYKSAIFQLMEVLQGETQMESAVSNCLEIMKDTIGCEAGFIWVLAENINKLITITSAFGLDKSGVVVEKNQGIIGQSMQTGETVTSYGEIRDDSPLYGSDEAVGFKSTSQMVTPIRTQGGQAFGCIHLLNKNEEQAFDEMDIRLAENLASLIALDILEKGDKITVPLEKEPMLELKGVTREFTAGDNVIKVLRGIDLVIYPNEFLVVLGESGCGKTTMMNIIGGMDQMTSGEMYLDGRDFSHPSDDELTAYRRDYIGYIFQAYNLMPNLTALENLKFIAEISKEPESPEKMLDLVGLTERAGNFPSMMSGGQQQRVSIARALTKNPRLILADEPTAALDYQTSIEVLEIVEKVVKESGKTVVMITHNPEIAKMANRVVKVRGGLISSVRLNLHPLHATDLVW